MTDIVMESNAEGALLRLSGEVGIYSALQLHDTALNLVAADSDVTIEIGELSQLDTSVLQILCALQRELHAHGRGLRFAGASPAWRETLLLTGLAATFVNDKSPSDQDGV